MDRQDIKGVIQAQAVLGLQGAIADHGCRKANPHRRQGIHLASCRGHLHQPSDGTCGGHAGASSITRPPQNQSPQAIGAKEPARALNKLVPQPGPLGPAAAAIENPAGRGSRFLQQNGEHS